ncbi:MAG: hypothetical protein IKU18_06905, partial [Bacteroidales bacterium]|nr:hypothetical protein [Bacteroidales bacterium]
YEADDAIGSMATQWKGENNQIYMVTPDKDYGQLIDTNVFQYKPAKGGNEIEIIGKEQICSNYGICNPEQVIDILTIWGDSSDNVPGIRGIGEVGAKKLIGKFGSLQGILDNVSQLPQKQQDAINESREQIMMSRFLVTIKTDMQLPVSLDQIQLKPLNNYNAINEIFNKFEFNSLRKLLPDSSASAGNNTAGNSSTTTPLPLITEAPMAAVLDSALIAGNIAIGFTDSQAVILAVKPQDTATQDPQGNAAQNVFHVCTAESLKELEKDGEIFCRFKKIMEDGQILKIGYGFKQVIKMLIGAGIDLNGVEANGYLSNIGDIELMHYLLNPERSHKEELLIKSYLKIDLQDLENGENNEVQPQEPQMFDLFSAPAEQENSQQPSNRETNQCALLIPLYKEIIKELEASGQLGLYNEIEMPLTGILADMELQGVTIDTQHLKAYSIELTKELDEIEQQARELAQDQSLNLSSPKQVGVLLYEKLVLNPKAKKSAKGNWSTDEETLSELADKHPIVNKILEYRALKKLLSTYIDNFPSLISKETGKVHTTFNQTVTATGRLSSANPNLQNIP